LSNLYNEAREIYKFTDEEGNYPPNTCPLLGQDITKVFHQVFDFSNQEGPHNFDLKHIGIKTSIVIGNYMANTELIKNYIDKHVRISDKINK